MTKRPTKLGAFVEHFWSGLEEHPSAGDEPVWVDTPLGWLRPRRLHSYRGFYDQLAVTVSIEYGTDQLTATRLYGLLSEALEGERTFEGYKGGTYRMGPDTYVWVTLDYSRTSSLVLSGIEKLEGQNGWF